jgi:hypothetical protein
VKNFNKTITATMLCLGLVVPCGCVLKPSPPSKPAVEALTRPLAGINRVVFVGLAERNSYPGIAKDMTTALSHAVQARGLFGLDVIHRQDPICEDVSMLDRNGFTIQQITEMRQTFKCDGILLGSINDFVPHPQMKLGVRLRMVDLKRGRILWAVDHVWDTTDKAVENRIQRFFSEQMRSGYEPMDWQIAMISPRVFEKFIAYELAETLPDPVQVSTGSESER